MSWLRPSVLWRSRNDLIAKHLYDPTDAARSRWIALAHERARRTGADGDFVVRRGNGDATSLLLIGDSGEGDDSQYAVIPSLLSQAEGIDFAVICSDVVYPSGDIGDYRDKFYRPYARLQAPVFGIPGNHDWYDGLHGFMHHLCGIDAPDAGAAGGSGPRGALARLLWRRSPRPDDADLEHMKRPRSAAAQRLDPPQPAPYLAIDAGPVRLVTIDTGIRGEIDAEQAAWLRRVSLADERPKVLLTGKPIYVDGKHHPGRIAGEGGTVDDIVRDPRAGYVAAIGGDVHNYQRYPVRLPDDREIQYVVSGGGGAFMHATHQIPRIDVPGVGEDDFRCYPLRSDSLARYSQLYDRRLGGTGALRLAPEEAAAYLAGLLDMDPTRGDAVPRLSWRARTVARFLKPAPATRGFQRWVSEAFDWNDPPLFKHFLRLDITAAELRIRCFGVTGCADSETDPPVEDDVAIDLRDRGPARPASAGTRPARRAGP
jgi:hypothetical protein